MAVPVAAASTPSPALTSPSALRPLGPGTVAALLLVLAGAAALRAWNLAHGLPYAVGVDEPEIMERVVRMMKTGDFDPRFFDWPSLTLYLHLVVACVTFLGGAMHGAWNSLAQAGPANFYLNARIVTAAIGTATVGVLFAAGRRWGPATALLAAAILAVMPNHVRESHYALADVPTAFFTTLALLMAIRAHECPRLGRFAAAGLVVGLAASCKYNGLVAIVLPLIAALGAGGGWRVTGQRLGVVIGMAGLGFLAGTPYAVLDLPKFLADYARLAAVFATPRPGEAGWSLYLKYLQQSLGAAGLGLALVGLLASLWTVLAGPGRVRAALLVTFPPLYFKVMANSHQIYGRYTLPLLPGAALLAAVGAATLLVAIRPRVPGRRGTLVTAAVVLGVLAAPLWSSVGFVRFFGHTGTVDRAYGYLVANAPAGASIVSETHPIVLTQERYRVRNVRPLLGSTFEAYRAAGVDYVIASSVGYKTVFEDPQRFPAEHAAYVSLFGQGRRVAVFPAAPGVAEAELTVFRISEPPVPSR